MIYTVSRESRESLVDRYRDLSIMSRLAPVKHHDSIFVGFVTHDGNAYRFTNTPAISSDRFEYFVAGLENAYRPLIIYAVHR